jgi:hypothetical protein
VVGSEHIQSAKNYLTLTISSKVYNSNRINVKYVDESSVIVEYAYAVQLKLRQMDHL